jgi:hypothetical protein
MTPSLAGAIGGFMLVVAGVVAMAALSHCPRRLRAWPALLLALGALVASDRLLKLMSLQAPMEDVRSWLVVLALGAALATILALCWVITTACPICRSIKPRNGAPKWFLAHINRRDNA